MAKKRRGKERREDEVDVRKGWRNELKPGGATFEFSFTMLSRRRFAPPRSHSFTGAFQARNNDKLTIDLNSSSTIIIRNSKLNCGFLGQVR